MPRTRATKHGASFIYFIQLETGPVKIGITTDIGNRVSAYQAHVPYDLRLLWLEVGTLTDERRYHNQFQAYRIRGEWFHPADEVMAALATRRIDAAELSDIQTFWLGRREYYEALEITSFASEPWWLRYAAPRSAGES